MYQNATLLIFLKTVHIEEGYAKLYERSVCAASIGILEFFLARNDISLT